MIKQTLNMRLSLDYHDMRRCCNVSRVSFVEEIFYANDIASIQEDDQSEISKEQRMLEVHNVNEAQPNTNNIPVGILPSSQSNTATSALPLPPTKLHDGLLFRKVG